jgi:hypothetical protein
LNDERRLAWFTAGSAWFAVLVAGPVWLAYATVAVTAIAGVTWAWRLGYRAGYRQGGRRVSSLERRADGSA